MELYDFIEDYIKRLTMRTHSYKTVLSYERVLKKFLYFTEGVRNVSVDLCEISVRDVEGFLEYESERGLHPSSLNHSLYVIRAFFDYLEKRDLVKKNYARVIEPIKYIKKERVHLSEEEIEGLIKRVEGEVYKAAIATLAFTGLRISELCNLKYSDVDLQEGIIKVEGGKGAKNRVIPINKKLERRLKEYIKDKAPYEGHFFMVDSKSISSHMVNSRLKRAGEDLEKGNITAHILRHSFATNLIRKGISPFVVGKLLGHSDIRTTGIYVHSDLLDLKNAIEELGR